MAFLRTDPAEAQQILVLANLTDQVTPIDLGTWEHLVPMRDLLTDATPVTKSFTLHPYQVAWLEVASDR